MIAVVALFATANTVLITLIVCARMMYGMAKSSSLPASLAKVHKQRQTPYIGVILVGLVSIGFLFFKEIEILASISDVGIFLLFLVVNLSNIGLRYRRPDLNRPWHGPLNIGRMPLLSLLGAISCILMLFSINHPVTIAGIQFSSLLLGLAIFGAAIPLYFLLDRSSLNE
jgi:APA family basic amino acid/polyamine antiporter